MRYIRSDFIGFTRSLSRCLAYEFTALGRLINECKRKAPKPYFMLGALVVYFRDGKCVNDSLEFSSSFTNSAGSLLDDRLCRLLECTNVSIKGISELYIVLVF